MASDVFLHKPDATVVVFHCIPIPNCEWQSSTFAVKETHQTSSSDRDSTRCREAVVSLRSRAITEDVFVVPRVSVSS
jgi:hypothetical protein